MFKEDDQNLPKVLVPPPHAIGEENVLSLGFINTVYNLQLE